jgi:hypothetical protein
MRQYCCMTPPLLVRFEEQCAAAKLSPTAVLKAADIHPSLWWKWRTGRVSPTLRSFEAALSKLQEMGGQPCGCGGDCAHEHEAVA